MNLGGRARASRLELVAWAATGAVLGLVVFKVLMATGAIDVFRERVPNRGGRPAGARLVGVGEPSDALTFVYDWLVRFGVMLLILFHVMAHGRLVSFGRPRRHSPLWIGVAWLTPAGIVAGPFMLYETVRWSCRREVFRSLWVAWSISGFLAIPTEGHPAFPDPGDAYYRLETGAGAWWHWADAAFGVLTLVLVWAIAFGLRRAAGCADRPVPQVPAPVPAA